MQTPGTLKSHGCKDNPCTYLDRNRKECFEGILACFQRIMRRPS